MASSTIGLSPWLPADFLGRDATIAHLEAGNVESFLRDCNYCINSVFYANLAMFRELGVFERALVYWYSAPKYGGGRPQRAVENWFLSCDRSKLLAIGRTQPPASGSVTVYRGVSKFDSRYAMRPRTIRGCSWSLRLNAACYFATSLSQCQSAVYVAKVSADEIFLIDPPYHGSEYEVIVRPERYKRMPLTFGEIKAAGEAYERELKLVA